MEYISEQILFPEHNWDELHESVQKDLFTVISEIPDTTVDCRDGTFEFVSVLPFDLNFVGRYNVVKRMIKPNSSVFRKTKHIDSYYPKCYFPLRVDPFLDRHISVDDYIELVKAITMCLTNNTTVYYDTFRDNYDVRWMLENIEKY
jgi:hypothetical protein